jgi:hypothetical protein
MVLSLVRTPWPARKTADNGCPVRSWRGLAPHDDDRYRITAADGGIWLLRTPHPELAAGLAGRRPAVDTSRWMLGVWLWAHEGSSRLQDAAVADPAIIRCLGVGQAAYIYRGGVTFVQVKRLVGAPAALSREGGLAADPGAPATAERRSQGACRQAARVVLTGRPPLPDAGALLDEAFGGEPG